LPSLKYQFHEEIVEKAIQVQELANVQLLPDSIAVSDRKEVN
jgi:hypothetical protein